MINLPPGPTLEPLLPRQPSKASRDTQRIRKIPANRECGMVVEDDGHLGIRFGESAHARLGRFERIAYNGRFGRVVRRCLGSILVPGQNHPLLFRRHCFKVGVRVLCDGALGFPTRAPGTSEGFFGPSVLVLASLSKIHQQVLQCFLQNSWEKIQPLAAVLLNPWNWMVAPLYRPYCTRGITCFPS